MTDRDFLHRLNEVVTKLQEVKDAAVKSSDNCINFIKRAGVSK